MKARSLPAKGIYQILDANVNRAREGLRVVEEIFRFLRKDTGMTRRLKAMRREIEHIVSASSINPAMLEKTRNSRQDPGRGIHGAGEMRRASVEDIAVANMHRVAEALRVLEEFFKLFDVKASLKFKGMRFRFYDVEKAVHEALA